MLGNRLKSAGREWGRAAKRAKDWEPGLHFSLFWGALGLKP